LNLICHCVFSQERSIIRADQKYKDLAYFEAISIYEKVAKKGYQSVELFERLGNCYYFNSDFETAAKWYEQLFNLSQDIEKEYYYRFAQSLKSAGKYDKAKKFLDGFVQKNENDKRALLLKNNNEYLNKIELNSGRFKIADVGINSIYSDYGAAFFGNKLIFTSAREIPTAVDRKMESTNQAFSNLYESEIKSDGTMEMPIPFSNKVNTIFNEASAVFTKDGKTIYFTRNNYTNKKRGKSQDRITFLKLYKAVFENNEWTKIEELPFNSDQYSTAHPALSKDDKILYFASDMPGTFGMSDIFKVQIREDGTYGIPENLGTTINTEGKESFPFFSDDNVLYFASDGHPGLGGLDVFMSEMSKDGVFQSVENVGKPLNSNQDDFAFLINDKTRIGYFSSNRNGGKGNDDIYQFYETKKLTCQQILVGKVVDRQTSQTLFEAKVTFFDEKFNVIKEAYSDVSGDFKFDVICGQSYYIRASKNGFETKEINVNIPQSNGETNCSIGLEKRNIQFTIGEDVGPKIGIKKIFFDFNKYYIRPDAEIELQKILVLMNEYPKIKINISAHTDSRQSTKNNQILSENRAKSTMEWLLKSGISADRLTAKGYGESQLINQCADGVKCTEEDHQANRRSEFIIVSM
jgi:outer membrane protein OmpA-like peptidoglycan-associated protein/tetratricopeptide (TPR) repeat protein